MGIMYQKTDKRFVSELLSELPDIKRAINKIEVL